MAASFIVVGLPHAAQLEGFSNEAGGSLSWKVALFADPANGGASSNEPALSARLTDDFEVDAGLDDRHGLLNTSVASDDGGSVAADADHSSRLRNRTVSLPFEQTCAPNGRVAIRLQLLSEGALLGQGVTSVTVGETAAVRPSSPFIKRASAVALRPWSSTAIHVPLSLHNEEVGDAGAAGAPRNEYQLTITWVPAHGRVVVGSALEKVAANRMGGTMPSSSSSAGSLPIYGPGPLTQGAEDLSVPLEARKHDVYVTVQGALFREGAAGAMGSSASSASAFLTPRRALPMVSPSASFSASSSSSSAAAAASGVPPAASLPDHLSSFTVAVALCKGSGELLTPPQVVGAAVVSEAAAESLPLGGVGVGALASDERRSGWKCDWRYTGRVSLPPQVFAEGGDGFDSDLHLLFYLLTPPTGQPVGAPTAHLPVVAAFAYLRLFDDPPGGGLQLTSPSSRPGRLDRHRPSSSQLGSRLEDDAEGEDGAAVLSPPPRGPAFLADRRHSHGAHGTEVATPEGSSGATATSSSLPSDGGVVVSSSLRVYTGAPPFLPAGPSGGAMFAASPAAAPVGCDSTSASPSHFPVPPHLQMISPLPSSPAAATLAAAQASGAFPSSLSVTLRVLSTEPDVIGGTGVTSWCGLLAAVDRDDADEEAGLIGKPPGAAVAAALAQHASAAMSSSGAVAMQPSTPAPASAPSSLSAHSASPALVRYRSLTAGPAALTSAVTQQQQQQQQQVVVPPHLAMSLLRSRTGTCATASDVLKQHQPVLSALGRHYTAAVAAMLGAAAASIGGEESEDAAAARFQTALVEAPPAALLQAVTSALMVGAPSASAAAPSIPLTHSLPIAAGLATMLDVLLVLASAQTGIMGGVGAGGGSDTGRDDAASQPLSTGSSRAAVGQPSPFSALPMLAADIDSGLFGSLESLSNANGPSSPGDESSRLNGNSGPAAYVPGLLTPGLLSTLLLLTEGAAVEAIGALQRDASSSSSALSYWLRTWCCLLSLCCTHLARTGELLGVWSDLQTLAEDELGAAGASTSASSFVSDPPSHLRRSLFSFLAHLTWGLSALRNAAGRGSSNEAAASAHSELSAFLLTSAGPGPWSPGAILIAAAVSSGLLPSDHHGASVPSQLTSLLLSLCLPLGSCDVSDGDVTLTHVLQLLLPLIAPVAQAPALPVPVPMMVPATPAAAAAAATTPNAASSVIAKYRPQSLYSKRTGVPTPLPQVTAASAALMAGGVNSSFSGRPWMAAQPRGPVSRYPALLSALTSAPPPRVRLRASKASSSISGGSASKVSTALAGTLAAESAALLRARKGASAPAVDVEGPHGQRLLAVYSGGLTLALRSLITERSGGNGSAVAGMSLAAAQALSALLKVAALSPAVGAAVLGVLLQLTSVTTRHGSVWDLPLLLLMSQKMAAWADTAGSLDGLPQPLVTGVLSASAEALSSLISSGTRLQSCPSVFALSSLVRHLRSREARGEGSNLSAGDLLAAFPQCLPLALFLHAQSQGSGIEPGEEEDGEEEEEEGLLDGATGGSLGATSIFSRAESRSDSSDDPASSALLASLSFIASVATSALQQQLAQTASSLSAGSEESASPTSTTGASVNALADLQALAETAASNSSKSSGSKSALGKAAASLLTALSSRGGTPSEALAVALMRCVSLILLQVAAQRQSIPSPLASAVVGIALSVLLQCALSASVNDNGGVSAACGEVILQLLPHEGRGQRSGSAGSLTAAEAVLIRASLQVTAPLLASQLPGTPGADGSTRARCDALMALLSQLAAISARIASLRIALAGLLSTAEGPSLGVAQSLRSLLVLINHIVSGTSSDEGGTMSAVSLVLWRCLAAAHGWTAASAFDVAPAQGPVDFSSAARSLLSTAQLAVAFAADDAPASPAAGGILSALGLTSHASLLSLVETSAAGGYVAAVRCGEWGLASAAGRLLQSLYASLAGPAGGGGPRSINRRAVWNGGALPDCKWWETPGAPASFSGLAAALVPQGPQALASRSYLSGVAAQVAADVLQNQQQQQASSGEPSTMPAPQYLPSTVMQLEAVAAAVGGGDAGAGPLAAAVCTTSALCAAGILHPLPLVPAYALVASRNVPGFGGSNSISDSSASGGSPWQWAVLQLPPGATMVSLTSSLREGWPGVPVHGPEVPVLASEARTVTTTMQQVPLNPYQDGQDGQQQQAMGPFGAYPGLPQFTPVPIESVSSSYGLLGTGSTAAAALADDTGANSPACIHLWPLLKVEDGSSDSGLVRLRAWIVRSATAVTETGRSSSHKASSSITKIVPHSVSALGAPLLLSDKFSLSHHGNPDGLLDGTRVTEDEDEDQQDGEEGGEDGRQRWSAANGRSDRKKRRHKEPAVPVSASPLLQLDLTLPSTALASGSGGSSASIFGADEASTTWDVQSPQQQNVGEPVLPSDSWATRLLPVPAGSVSLQPIPLAVGAAEALQLAASSGIDALSLLLRCVWLVDGLHAEEEGGRRRRHKHRHRHHHDQQQQQEQGPRSFTLAPSQADDEALVMGGPALRFDDGPAGAPIQPPPSTPVPATSSGGLEAVQLPLMSAGDAVPMPLLLGLPPLNTSAGMPAASLMPGVAVADASNASADLPPLEHDATALCNRVGDAAAKLLPPSSAEVVRVPVDEAGSVALAYALASGGGAVTSSALQAPSPLLTPASAAELLLSAGLGSVATSSSLLRSARWLLCDYGELKSVWREKRVTELRREWIREDEALAAAGYDTSDREVPDFAAMLPRRPHEIANRLDAAAASAVVAAGATASALQAAPTSGQRAALAAAVEAVHAGFGM